MRTFLIALIALLATWPLPAGAATRNFGINSFDRIRVDGPFSVRARTGVAPFARATGSPAALDRIAIEVQGRTLIVHSSRSSWGGYPGADHGAVEIEVGSHELSAVWLNGSGNVQIDKVKGMSFGLSVQGSGAAGVARADVDQLNVGVGGSASATLGGRAGKLTATVRGVSTLDASTLAARDAKIGAVGTATVKANVSNTVSVDGSGPATVTLSGKPSCALKLSGSASVSGCR